MSLGYPFHNLPVHSLLLVRRAASYHHHDLKKIIDPLGILEEGEVYYRASQPMTDPETQTLFNVLTGDVLVSFLHVHSMFIILQSFNSSDGMLYNATIKRQTLIILL